MQALLHSIKGVFGDNAASATIAFCALILTVYQLWYSIRFSKLANRPYLSIADEFTDHADRIGLFLENYGLGPALVVKWEFLIDNKSYSQHGLKDFSEIPEFLGLHHKERITFDCYRSGFIIGKDKKREFMTFRGGRYSKDRNDVIRGALSRVKFILTYRSLFDNKDYQEVFDGAAIYPVVVSEVE